MRGLKPIVAVAAVIGVFVGGSQVAAAANCTTTGNVVTCVFSYTGSEQTFTVPAGVVGVSVDAVGGHGASGGAGVGGGSGADVTGDLATIPGSQLYIEVGGDGSSGGFNGGGGGGYGGYYVQGWSNGGTGGGASDLRTVASGQSGSLSSRLLVAGRRWWRRR